MHFDFASALNLVSIVTLIGALVFTGLQVRAANRARREHGNQIAQFRATRPYVPAYARSKETS